MSLYTYSPTILVSIHAPLTGGDVHVQVGLQLAEVSIHAPLTGGDHIVIPLKHRHKVSIHAPLTGGDRLSGRVKK